ncbi:MAG TPA: AraC family transcriptional regulator ligand-binding domain-containing protein [Polyangiaceae bacterium]|nr:AraC family transcriptional regulator ligand-binding domain-containing protein [Polyangiaceae bacterium]
MIQTLRDERTVPGCLILQIIELVRDWDVSPADLLKGLSTTERELEEKHTRWPLTTYVGAIERARMLTREPGIGLCWGLQMRPSAYGYLGFAAMSAPTLRGALELVVEFAALISTGISLRLEEEGTTTSLVIEELADFGSVRDVVIGARLTGLWRIACAITGRDLPAHAEVALPEPDYYARFAHLVPGVRYGREVTRAVMSREVLDSPLLMADAAALRLARRQCERQLEALEAGGPFVRAVRHLLWKGEAGVRSPLEVAKAVHMSPRTLRRKLASQGSSLSALLEEERRERAMALLRAPDLTIEQVSERLGYRSVQNFTRAFRQWTGATPGAYRRSCAGGLALLPAR